ncbi:hexosaminidase D-like [Epargyreus clarus]|uniref:hexosaminidase D-like n=1 Tax=Epargyreus clarus TaxID=520877 RepID=UPI003C2BDC83
MIKTFKIRLAVAKMKSTKVKYLLLGVFIALCLVYILTDIRFLRKHKVQVLSVKLPNVVVHFDLKGSPPKLSYLTSLLPMLKRLGVTGFLMEYEDMFPYEGRLVNLSASNRYEKSELKEFIITLISTGFEIIPLVQTFGHMEHALKLAEFQHLREVPFYPDSLCPSQKESIYLVEDMIRQVIKFHNDVAPLKHFHIGCDEVYHINKCDKCRNRILSDIELFVNHVEVVKNTVKKLSPTTTVLIWDDMLRSRNITDWDKITSFNNVEPVYWDYRKKVDLSHVSLLKYHNTFKEIWIASAFKGADGRTATLPNMKHRVMNHLSWMNQIRGYKFGGETDIYNFKGIILTGWSRYSHMDPPCELLPSSLPSLVVNLLLIQQFKYGIPKDYKFSYVDDFFGTFLLENFNKHLYCGSSISVEYFDNYQCTFDGNELYKVQRLNDLIYRNITIGFHDINHGLSTLEFYSNTNDINRIMAESNFAWCNETLTELSKIERQMIRELFKYFNRSFIKEYVNLKTNNGKRILYKLLKALTNSMNIQTWSRRPYY